MVNRIADLMFLSKLDPPLEEFIPFSSILAPGVVITKNGDLLATWRLSGVSFETLSEAQKDTYTNAINAALRGIGSEEYAVVSHRSRRVISDELDLPTHSLFAQEMIEKYNYMLNNENLMISDLHITLVYKTRYKTTKIKQSPEVSKTILYTRLEEFIKTCGVFESSLQTFSPRRLKEREINGVEYSQQLTFYNFLLTGSVQPIRVIDGPIYKQLGNVDLFVGPDIIQIRNEYGTSFAQAIEIKEFSNATYSGIFDTLFLSKSLPPYEFVETQIFCPESKRKALGFLKLQRDRLAASKDDAVTQILDLDQARNDVANDIFSLGEYSYILTVFGNSDKEVRANSSDAMTKLNEEGYTTLISTTALAASYFAMLPSNFSWRPRVARLTSINFAHQAPLHNFPQGKRDHNPWGQAVTIFETISHQPFYFNFHVTRLTEKSEGTTPLGHTMILGQSGAGKTVLINFLVCQLQKYIGQDDQKTSIIYFDKDYGAELAIRASRGGYLSLKTGEPTGFNPFQLENTAENRSFLVKLLSLLIKRTGREISPYDEKLLTEAVSTVMNFDKEVRSINLIPQNLPEGLTKEERENSLAICLSRWVDGGDLAWVFNNPKDELDLDTNPIFGIDGTEMLKNEDVKAAISLYLLYKVKCITDGRRLIQVMDEFWQWLSDPVFEEYAKDNLKTGRKMNLVCIFATQSPSDMLQSDIARAVIEQCATQILLPNNKAEENEYVEYLKTTPTEFANIKALLPTSRAFIVKQADTSIMCRLNLYGFDDEMNILSGSTENTNLVHELMYELKTTDPDVWIPKFYELKREQKAQAIGRAKDVGQKV